MSDCMHFPDTVEEFMEQYKMTDAKQVYSNGIEYVPIFRMEQWFEHEKTQLSQKDATSDLISRQQALKALIYAVKNVGVLDANDIRTVFKALPTIQPVATDTNVGDTISRQSALEKVRAMQTYKLFMGDDMILVDKAEVQTELMMLPPAKPEPSIPLSWVEKYIEWLKGFDNEFANLEAAHISVMVKKWRDEQDETD